jgi:hypothetical protein
MILFHSFEIFKSLIHLHCNYTQHPNCYHLSFPLIFLILSRFYKSCLLLHFFQVSCHLFFILRMHFLKRTLQVFFSIIINFFEHLGVQNLIWLFQTWFKFLNNFFEIHCTINMVLLFWYQNLVLGLQIHFHCNYYLNHNLKIIYFLSKTLFK